MTEDPTKGRYVVCTPSEQNVDQFANRMNLWTEPNTEDCFQHHFPNLLVDKKTDER